MLKDKELQPVSCSRTVAPGHGFPEFPQPDLIFSFRICASTRASHLAPVFAARSASSLNFAPVITCCASILRARSFHPIPFSFEAASMRLSALACETADLAC
jgi:hypothetical protein